MPALKSTLKPALFPALDFSLLLRACSDNQPEVTDSGVQDEMPVAVEAETNPLLVDSSLPYGMPPFDQIRNEHYLPAYGRAMAPRLSAHNDSISLNPDLIARVDTLYQQREELALDPESDRLLERYHTSLVRAGAELNEEQKDRLREINSELASLSAQFTRNVLAEVNASAVVVDSGEELAGLSNAQIQAAAAERGSRGNEFDTTGIVSDTLKLRAERAQMLGYDTHADFILSEQTAGSKTVVNQMLGGLAPVVVANARVEVEEIKRVIDETEAEPFELEAWDWAYYAEKVRQDRYAFDESEVRPYFELNNVLDNGVFYAAEQAYGLSFERRDDLPTYHPDVQVWEVFDVGC